MNIDVPWLVAALINTPAVLLDRLLFALESLPLAVATEELHVRLVLWFRGALMITWWLQTSQAGGVLGGGGGKKLASLPAARAKFDAPAITSAVARYFMMTVLQKVWLHDVRPVPMGGACRVL
ncbi:MAG: hypothetical protein WA917_12970 [Comamonas sp.]